MQGNSTHKIIDGEVYRRACVYEFFASDSGETPGIMQLLDMWYQSDLGDFVLKNMFGNVQVLSQFEINSYFYRVHVIAWLKPSDLTYMQIKWPQANLSFE